jgi:hypothetical protein
MLPSILLCAPLAHAQPAPAAAAPSKDRCLDAYVGAQRLRKKGALLAAKAELLVCAQPTCPGELVRDCSGWLADVERRTPTLVVEVVDADTRVVPRELIVDGSAAALPAQGAALEIDPGQHEIVVVLGDERRLAKSVLVLEGEKEKRVRFELASPRQAEKRKRDMTPVYAFGITSAVATGSFAFFALRSHGKRNDLEACKGHCAEDAVNDVRREQIAADVSLVVALLSAGAATYFALKPVPEVQVGAALSDRSGLFTLRRRF